MKYGLDAHLSVHPETLDQRVADHESGYGRFFTELAARIEGARARDRERDRLLAHRFNALDYLRVDELGLSRIIRDLLDPDGTHGQGVCFLAKFADLVGPDRWPTCQPVRYDEFDIKVQRERATDGGGRLDISVEIRPRGQGAACIAFENKPYAADGEAQVADYLEFLRRHYGRRFLLIYLSGHGGMPSEHSLPGDADKDGLATMSFCPRATDGEDNIRFRLPFSLSEWLQECRQICDAERPRWFLGEVEKFCDKEFGGIVTTTSEHKEVSDFILANDDNLQTALAVVEVWPEVLKRVVEQFLGGLRKQIGADLGSFVDLQTRSSFHGRPKNGVWASRGAWSENAGAVPFVSLSHEGQANHWFLGIGLDSGTGDAQAADSLRERLRERLSRQSNLQGSVSSRNWPWYRYLEEHKDWGPLLICLHRESQEPGELMAWFSQQFVETAILTIPVIDEVLGVAE